MNIILIIVLLGIILIFFWAIFGGRGEDRHVREGDDPDPEKTFRRRESDKQIEEEYPDQDKPYGRRKSDRAMEIPDEEDDEELNLPYRADEIISDTSRFRIYKRTLLNAEIYAKKGDFSTAVSLYEGVHNRIHDADTRFKIEADIEYLKQFREKREEAARRKEEEARKELAEGPRQSYKAGEVTITFDGSVPESINIDKVPNNVNIGVIDPEKSINIGNIADQIRDQLRDMKGDIDDLRQQPSQVPYQPRPEGDVSSLMSEIQGLKDQIKSMETGRELGQGDLDLIEGIKTGLESDDLKKQLQEMADRGARQEDMNRMRREIDYLRESMMNLTVKQADLLVDRDSISGPGGTGGVGGGGSAEEAGGAGGDAGGDGGPVIVESEDRPVKVDTEDRPVVVESDEKPVLIEARETAPLPVTIDTEPLEKLLDRIPKIEVPGPSDIKGPKGDGAPAPPGYDRTGESETEKIKEREKADEEEDDFELLSELGKEKDDDQLSDEEIFDKILKSDKPDKDDSFEILGEKKEDEKEFTISGETSQKQREDERFYRNLIKTDKRKKRELPILKVSYDFTKLPEEVSLSREKNIMEYSFYKYKPMLDRAHEFIDKRKVRDAINYYKVVMAQNIPPEFKAMIRKNISDLTEYLEKYLTGD